MDNKITKVVFLSNYFNHHQKPFADELFKRLGKGYKFIETGVMSEERKKLGWGMENIPEYVIPAVVLRAHLQEGMALIDDADVVIIGSAPEFLIKNRLKDNKLVFRYSERPLKKGIELLKYPVRFYRWRKNNPMKSNLYLLCASAYASADYAKFGLFKNRAYKWAYFPTVKEYESIEELIQNKKTHSIVWTARFIDWKHPEMAVELAKRLKSAGYDFVLNMIGTGPMVDEIKKSITENGLDENVCVLGSMKPEAVREYMEGSEIYIFTSDRQEGWGAVLNESMNSACAVVASHAAGSTRFLIEHGKNGLVFKSESLDSLYENVKLLLDNPQKRKELSKNAYESMVNEWNAKNAADRFVTLSECILSGEKYANPFKKGVCSKAERLKDSWRKNG